MLQKSFNPLCILLCSFLTLIIPGALKAQLPVNGAGIIYLKSSQNNSIIGYDPTQPMSAANPSINTIQTPVNSHGIAVSEVLGSGNPTLTFYTVVDGNYWYYNPVTAAWVNTNQTNSPALVGANIGGGGGLMYHLAWGNPAGFNIDGNVYKYDGSGNGAYLITLPNFSSSTTMADLVVDCAGNFYTFSLMEAFLRKYNPNGVLIQEWTVNNPNNYNSGGSLPGFAIVDNKLYIQIETAGVVYNITYGDIGATSVDFTSPLLPLFNNLHGEDFASTPFVTTPSISISTPDTILCPGTTATFTATASGVAQNNAFQWFVNGVAIPGQTGMTYTYIPNDGDIITCTAQVPASDCFLAGSVTSNAITMHIAEPPPPEMKYEPSVFCKGELITATPSFTPPGGTFTATGLNIDPATGTIGMNDYTPGVYAVTYTTRLIPGCDQKSATDTIIITPKPVADITQSKNGDICLDDTFAVYAAEVPGYTYEWLPANVFPAGNTNARAVARIRGSSTIALYVTNEYGCRSSDSIFIKSKPCCELFVSNAFSPNGDGTNEYFLSESRTTQKILQFSIYNRWGERVFLSYNQHDGWNGLHNEKPADPGTYFYYLHYECADGKLYVKKGDLTLIR